MIIIISLKYFYRNVDFIISNGMKNYSSNTGKPMNFDCEYEYFSYYLKKMRSVILCKQGILILKIVILVGSQYNLEFNSYGDHLLIGLIHIHADSYNRLFIVFILREEEDVYLGIKPECSISKN